MAKILPPLPPNGTEKKLMNELQLFRDDFDDSGLERQMFNFNEATR